MSRRELATPSWRAARVCLAGCALVLGLIFGIGIVPAAAQTPGQKTGPLRVNIPKDPFGVVATRFRNLARRDDKARRWHRALLRWKVVAAFTRKDREAAQRIEAIETWVKKQADQYMKAAGADLKKKQYGAAFRNFLKVLAYDSENNHALQMIKSDLNARSIQDYTVVRGDTPPRIAKKAYGDEELVFLVQYFNNLKRTARLRPGTAIKIPVLADVLPARPVRVATTPPPAPAKAPGTAQAAVKPRPPAPKVAAPPAAVAKAEAPPPAPKVEVPPAAVAKAETPATPEKEAPAAAPTAPAKEEAPAAAPIAPTETTLVAALEAGAGASLVLSDLSPSQESTDYDISLSKIGLRHAQALYDAGQFADSAAQAEQVLEDDPVNQDARKMIDESYYAMGMQQNEKGDLLDAMQSFSRVTPGFKDATARKKELAGKLQDQQAEVHYIAGVTAFLEEDLDGAIREWEQVLKLDPGHPQATKDLANARSLKARLAQVQ